MEKYPLYHKLADINLIRVYTWMYNTLCCVLDRKVKCVEVNNTCAILEIAYHCTLNIGFNEIFSLVFPLPGSHNGRRFTL